MSNIVKAKKQSQKMLNVSSEDFASPIAFKNFNRATSKSEVGTNRIKTKRPTVKKQITLHQMVKDNFQHSDINPEHLQMALALSKSTSEIENNIKEEFSCSSGSNKHVKIGSLLEFGFKRRSKISMENRMSKREVVKRNKKSKFTFITPILLMRTEEERESLIQSKISMILTQNCYGHFSEIRDPSPSIINNEELKKVQCMECSIFFFNNKINELSNEIFSVPDLSISENRAKCGSLLKDWKKIPLRDHTPERLKIIISLNKNDVNLESHVFDSNSNEAADKELYISNSFGSEQTDILTTSNDSVFQNTAEKINISKNLFNSEHFSPEKDISKICDTTKNMQSIVIDQTKERNMISAISPDLFDYDPLQNSIGTSNREDGISTSVKRKLEHLFPQMESDSEKKLDNMLDDTLTVTSNQVFEPIEFPVKRGISSDSGICHYDNYSTECDKLYLGDSSNEESEQKSEKSCDVFDEGQDIIIQDSQVPPDVSEGDRDLGYHIISSSDEENEIINIEKPLDISEEELQLSKNVSPSNRCSENVPNGMNSLNQNCKQTSLSTDQKYTSESNKLIEKFTTSFYKQENKLEAYPTNFRHYCFELEESQNVIKKCSTSKGSVDEISDQEIGDNPNKSYDSNFISDSEDNLPIIQVKSIPDYRSIIEKEANKCNLDNNRVQKYFTSSLFSNDVDVDEHSHIEDDVKNTEVAGYSSETKTLSPSTIQGSLLSVGEKSPNLNEIQYNTNCQNFSGFTSKDSITLNLTEHIHDILKYSYGQVDSLKLSDVETEKSFNEEKEKYPMKENRSTLILSTSGELKNLMTENFELSECAQKNKNTSQSRDSLSFDDVVCISDEELNYSSTNKQNYVNSNNKNQRGLSADTLDSFQNITDSDQFSSTPIRRFASFIENSTPNNACFARTKSEASITPNRKVMVKLKNVTPAMDYDKFSTPVIVKELSKFGLKPLKRKRGVNLLKHIYEVTHPVVEAKKGEVIHENDKVLKKLKKNENSGVLQAMDDVVPYSVPQEDQYLDPWEVAVTESDFIFERQRSSKKPTCQIPLQIVWHNFIVQNPQIRENILLYEPLQVEWIHNMLKELGFKFHLQDLITFLDRKCITIRVAQSQNKKTKD